MAMRQSRRSFLKKSLAAGGATAAAFLGAPGVLAAKSPNNRLGVAVIGAGGMGGYSLGAALRENLVAVVDVDDRTIAKAMDKAGKAGAKPKVFFDYRKMLDACRKDLDVVLIATPDHNHAPAAIRAIDLGKATFCQKPLAHNIYEVYALMKAAREKKVPTQMGNQRHCGEGIRRVVEYIRAGAIGNVVETHTILGRNFGGTGGRPPSKPTPSYLHWNEWLGPAPYRDYHDGLHPFSWRSWRDFGTGTIGDMACHHVDFPFWALRLAEVRSFQVTCLNTTGGSEEMWPQNNIVRYDIPPRGDMPAVKVFVYDHKGLKPEVMKETEKKYNRRFGEFTLFVGEKGLMGSDARIIPQEKHQATPAPPKTLPRAKAGDPIGDLYHAVREGSTPCSNFIDAAGPLTAFVLTGHLAQLAGVGKTLHWDVEKMQCTNVPAVNQYIKRTYRKGWEV